MFRRRFRLPSPALVIATIALGVALGGTAVAASMDNDKAADTRLIRHLAPSLNVRSAHYAKQIGNLIYVKGNVVDAPANGGSGFAESPGSEADCPINTYLIGSTAYAGGQGVEASPTGVHGDPPDGVRVYFDNFTNADAPTNYSIAICAAAHSFTNPDNLSVRKAARR